MRAAAAAALVMGAGAADAQVDPLAAAFGAREDVEQASLSPDGTKLAFLRPNGGQGSAIMTLDLTQPDAKPVGIAAADGKPERLSNCRWVGNTRLMCTIYGIVRVDNEIAYSSRIVALDADGKRVKGMPMPRGFGVALSSGAVIDWNPGIENSVLMMRQQLETIESGSMIGERTGGYRIDRVDTVSLKASPVERVDPAAREYYSDGQGRIRVIGRAVVDNASGYDRPGRQYFYRKPGENGWLPLSETTPDGAGFDPYGVDGAANLAYGLRRNDGRIAAYTMALDGSGKETLVFAHPEVDVSGFERIGRRGRIVGVSYVTDRRQVKYFDPALEKLAASLAKALPATPLIRFIDSSEDENLMLLWAGADASPGRYFLFDRRARKLEALLDDRPQLGEVKLAAMKPVTYPAADGTRIPGYLTLPPGKDSVRGLPALVMPHGGPGARDEWGFDWLAQFFAAKGYAVLQPNFRGSTGYGDAWFQKNGFKGWRTAIGDVNDAGKWLVAEGADAGRLGVFGWSYGGYAALQSAVVDPDLFKAIVAVAPVTDLSRLRGEGEMFSNYRIMRDFIGSGPHLIEGSPARYPDRFKAPVLMFHGDLDRNVSVAHAKAMQSKLAGAGKRSELVVYEGLDHYLEDGSARTAMLGKASAFLAASMPGK
ncbi:S9 family peptidase [Sphingomonas spermidinifaciens]|uniref:S9 family peptidase n=2 Tax=Sphingomonas spermidinifaciens TaxID=1141889 RepID=A0A2A4B0R0_9SPHN|nr:S9 family peptidase [Sphingomonas spermidinifaciens]